MKYPGPKSVKACNQHQTQMFPPVLHSLLEDDHLCLVVDDDVVTVLDLSYLNRKVSSEGNPAYHPAMILKTLFYSYATGIFNSRKIAKAIAENIAFINLAAGQHPDYRTISDFRSALIWLKNRIGYRTNSKKFMRIVQHVAVSIKITQSQV